MLKFYWVDDQEDKFREAKALIEKPPGQRRKLANCELLNASEDEDILLLVAKWAKMDRPDLLIIDHVFNKSKRRNQFKIAGSTVAHILRRTWADVPMVCVTAMLKDTQARRTHSNRESESQYLELFQYELLSENLNHLHAIARDFKKVVNTDFDQTGMKIVNLLDVPQGDKEVFLANLPAEFKEPKDSSTPHRLSRWILQVLMKFPGFLYSELRTATLLGLSLEGFRKVSNNFEIALYTGPFANNDMPLWWVEPLRRIIYKLTPMDAPRQTWLAGRLISGIAQSDFSKCYVNRSPDDIPDTVANLPPRGQEHPVCSKFTKANPSVISPPGFEQLRVIAES